MFLIRPAASVAETSLASGTALTAAAVAPIAFMKSLRSVVIPFPLRRTSKRIVLLSGYPFPAHARSVNPRQRLCPTHLLHGSGESTRLDAGNGADDGPIILGRQSSSDRLRSSTPRCSRSSTLALGASPKPQIFFSKMCRRFARCARPEPGAVPPRRAAVFNNLLTTL